MSYRLLLALIPAQSVAHHRVYTMFFKHVQLREKKTNKKQHPHLKESYATVIIPFYNVNY